MFWARYFPKPEMARMSARAREEADEAAWEAEWEAMSEAEAGAEWKDAFARAAAGTERGMAEAVAAADNERLMAEAAQAQAQAQAGAHQGTEWEAKFDAMVAHHAVFKCLLTWYESDEWVRTQRGDYAAGTMSTERQDRLNALPFWEWEPRFEVHLNDLAMFYQDWGRMPQKKGEGNVGLEDAFKWLTKQQRRYLGGMSEENKKKVEEFGGPVAAAIMGASAEPAPLLQVPSAEPDRAVVVIRRFPKPTDDGDARAREAHEFECRLLKVSRFYREKGRMPQKGDNNGYFEWVNEQERAYRRKNGGMAMPEDLKQRVRDEGGAVARAIMNEWQTPPKGGWVMNYGASLSQHGRRLQRLQQQQSNWP